MFGIILDFGRKMKRTKEKTAREFQGYLFIYPILRAFQKSDFKNVLLHFRRLRYLLSHPKALRGRFLPALC